MSIEHTFRRGVPTTTYSVPWPGEPADIGVRFVAAEFLDPGTVVTFELEAITLLEECSGLDRTTFTVVLD